MLRARRPYTANSLTYPSRQRATGLLGLMGLTDHNRATPEKAAEVGREPLSVVFFFLVPIWRNLVWLKFTKHSCKQWVCLWFTTVSDHAELLRFGFLLTLGLSHYGDLWPDKNRISASDLYSCNSKEYVMLLTFKLCLKVYFHTPKHHFFGFLPLSFLIPNKKFIKNMLFSWLHFKLQSFHKQFTTPKKVSVHNSSGEHQSNLPLWCMYINQWKGMLASMTAVMKDAFVFHLENNCRIKLWGLL